MLRRQVRTALAGSDNLEQFLERLRADGVLVRERLSTQNPDEVTGYAVALPHRPDNGQPIWFGGRKLAPDLTLPQLQRRWREVQPRVGKGPARAGKTHGASGNPAGKTIGDQTVGAGRARGIPDPDERARIWTEASAAAADGNAELQAAPTRQDLAGRHGAPHRSPATIRRPGTGMGLTIWLGLRPT